MNFLCKIVEQLDNNQYAIEIDTSNILKYPLENLSKRKITLFDNIDSGVFIYVLDSTKVDNTVIVNSYCFLSNPIKSSEKVKPNLEELSKELIEIISDNTKFPISILQYVQSNS